VLCLLTALEIHGIGVQAPFEVWIALPAGTHAPKSATASLRVTRLSGAAFTTAWPRPSPTASSCAARWGSTSRLKPCARRGPSAG
jgi:hypothetical protein